ncbi:hypothetical protein EJ110_NYTH42545 [Nymphaea thermarum]|nr:hypothetical protein EJ110_NYTH42545 [Nymphaea thermarum]
MFWSIDTKSPTTCIKLLSQPATSSCCERNWSTYSQIHNVKRNKLTSKRAEDLVYVHSNLCLLSRNSNDYSSNPDLSISHCCRRRPAASPETLCVACVCRCPLLLWRHLISCLPLLLPPTFCPTSPLPLLLFAVAGLPWRHLQKLSAADCRPAPAAFICLSAVGTSYFRRCPVLPSVPSVDIDVVFLLLLPDS